VSEWHREAVAALGAAYSDVDESVAWRIAASLRYAYVRGLEEARQKLDALDQRRRAGQTLGVDAEDVRVAKDSASGVADGGLVVDERDHAAHALESGALVLDVADTSRLQSKLAVREAELSQALAGLAYDDLVAAREVHDASALADAYAGVVHRAWRRSISMQKLAAEEGLDPEDAGADDVVYARADTDERLAESLAHVVQLDGGQAGMPRSIATQDLDRARPIVEERAVEVEHDDGRDGDADITQGASEDGVQHGG
jgi:hypothetical protein